MAKGPKPLPDRVDVEKEKLLALVARLYRRGWTQTEIADHPDVGVSQAMVSKYLTEVRTRWTDAMRWEMDQLMAEKLAQYAEVRKEAWEAWERSKLDRERVTDELAPTVAGMGEGGIPKVEPPKGFASKLRNRHGEKAFDKPLPCSFEASMMRIKRIIVKEGRLPADVFLRIIVESLKAERELLGLDAPKRVQAEVDAKVTQAAPLDWDALLLAAVNSSLNSVEEDVAREEAKAALHGRK